MNEIENGYRLICVLASGVDYDDMNYRGRSLSFEFDLATDETSVYVGGSPDSALIVADNPAARLQAVRDIDLLIDLLGV